MVTTASSSARQPLTVTLESTSSSSQPVRVERGCASMCYYVLLCATMCFFVLPVNRHGVNSSWMLLVGVNQILVFNLSGWLQLKRVLSDPVELQLALLYFYPIWMVTVCYSYSTLCMHSIEYLDLLIGDGDLPSIPSPPTAWHQVGY